MARLAARMKYMDAALTAGVKIENVSAWCRDNGIDRRTFYRHRKRVEEEGSWRPRSRRPKASPGQTPPEVEAQVVRLRKELAPDNGADAVLAALRGLAQAEDWAGRNLRVPHRSTVNRILKRNGLAESRPERRPRSSFRRFAYARPRDCYQVDATVVKLADGTPAAVFDVLDDCTRLLAACTAAPAETGKDAAAAIRAAASARGAPGIILCDNGTAFSGGAARGQGAFARQAAALGSRVIRSSPYHPQTCGKVERHHQTLKKWLAAQPAPPPTPGELPQLPDAHRPHYPTPRPPPTAVRPPPRAAGDAPASHGGPGRLPRQDDATIHHLTVAPNGNI